MDWMSFIIWVGCDILVGCAIACYCLAKDKNRNTTTAAICGLLFSVFAVIYYLYVVRKEMFDYHSNVNNADASQVFEDVK